MPTALVQGRIAVQYTDLLKKYLNKDWKVLVWDPAQNDPDEFVQMAAAADCIVGGGIPTQHWPAIPNLKLFQIPWTGYDFCSPATMPKDIPVCNCFEHESAIAEYVMGGMLEISLRLRQLDHLFRSGGWNGKLPGQNTSHGELRDKTVGVIGYGHIGHEVAKRAKAFDMRIIGTRRSKQETPELLDWLGTPDQMEKLLSESDFVVVACDLNAETEGMIGTAELQLMKPDAIIINVARGRVIAEQPLYEALKSHQIGGAVLFLVHALLCFEHEMPRAIGVDLRGVAHAESGTCYGRAVDQELLEGGGLQRLGAGVALGVYLYLDDAEQAVNRYAGKHPEPDRGRSGCPVKERVEKRPDDERQACQCCEPERFQFALRFRREMLVRFYQTTFVGEVFVFDLADEVVVAAAILAGDVFYLPAGSTSDRIGAVGVRTQGLSIA